MMSVMSSTPPAVSALGLEHFDLLILATHLKSGYDFSISPSYLKERELFICKRSLALGSG